MPFIEVTTGPLPQPQKRELVARLTEVFITPHVPADWVQILFRQIDPGDYVSSPVMVEGMVEK